MSCSRPRPSAPAERRARRPLRFDDAVDLARRRDGLQAGDEAEGVDVGCVDGGHARGVAALGEQQPAILLQHPAHRPRDVVARAAGDVRDVEAVAHEPDAVARHRLGARWAVRADAEALGLEGAPEVVRIHLVEARRQRVVELGLCIGARGHRHAAVLAGRDDVERGAGVVARERGGGCGEDDGRAQRGEQEAAHRATLVAFDRQFPRRSCRRPPG